MLQALEPERWAAVAQFQRQMAKYPSDSFESEIFDYSINLVLNTRRPLGSFFVRDAWRDSRSVVLRRRRRALNRCGGPLYGDGDNSLELSREASQSIGSSLEAETSIIATDAYRHLRNAVAGQNRYAAACLDAWRDGKEEHETAESLGISAAYVKKLRKIIRAIAAESLPEWRA